MPGPELLSKSLAYAATLLSILLLLVWRWEQKPMKFSVEDTDTGHVFTFSIGVFGGKVTLARDNNCTSPHFVRRFDGWDVVFPPCYSDEQMKFFMLTHNPDFSKNRSHSKDLDIYREVMIRRNSALACIAGSVYGQAT